MWFLQAVIVCSFVVGLVVGRGAGGVLSVGWRNGWLLQFGRVYIRDSNVYCLECRPVYTSCAAPERTGYQSVQRRPATRLPSHAGNRFAGPARQNRQQACISPTDSPDSVKKHPRKRPTRVPERLNPSRGSPRARGGCGRQPRPERFWVLRRLRGVDRDRSGGARARPDRLWCPPSPAEIDGFFPPTKQHVSCLCHAQSLDTDV